MKFKPFDKSKYKIISHEDGYLTINKMPTCTVCKSRRKYTFLLSSERWENSYCVCCLCKKENCFVTFLGNLIFFEKNDSGGRIYLDELIYVKPEE